MTYQRGLQLSFAGEGFFFLALAAGFACHSPWVTWLWTWGDAPMTDVLLAGLLASFGAGSLYLAAISDWRSAIGGSLSIVIAFSVFGVSIVGTAVAGTSHGLHWHGLVLAGVALIALGTTRSLLRIAPPAAEPKIDDRLRIAMAVLAVAVALSGVGLMQGVHGILPWAMSRQSELLLGSLFIGLAANYATVALNGVSGAFRVLLIGLIVFDTMLIGPLIREAMNTASAASGDLMAMIAFVTITGLAGVVVGGIALGFSDHPAVGSSPTGV